MEIDHGTNNNNIQVLVSHRPTPYPVPSVRREVTNLREFPSSDRFLNVYSWNIQRISNKTIYVCDMVLEQCIDILILQETWLKTDDDVITNELTPPGY